MKSKALLSISGWYLVLVVALFMQCTSGKDAAARLIRYEVKKGYLEQFQKALNDYVVYSLTIESNFMAEAYHEQENHAVFWLIERWKSKADLDLSVAGIQFKRIDSLSKEALTQSPKFYYMKDLEPLSKQQWRRLARREDHPFTVMLFVDTKSGAEEPFKNVYHTAMPQFRSEPGVITYQLSQLEEDDTQFVTYEKFRNDEAFQYHLKFPAVRPVIDFLETNIEKPPYQNGLHRLVEISPLLRE